MNKNSTAARRTGSGGKLPPLAAEFLLFSQYRRVRLTMDELADVLGLAVNTIYNQISAKTFPIKTYQDGRTRWADVRDVGEYLDSLREQAA